MCSECQELSRLWYVRVPGVFVNSAHKAAALPVAGVACIHKALNLGLRLQRSLTDPETLCHKH